MHALTCDLLTIGDYGYAMIPTYYQPNRFLKCKVYVEYVWHFEQSTFYHVTIAEILDDTFESVKKLSTAFVRCIHRESKKLSIQPMSFITTLSKSQMLTNIQAWHKDYVIDLPAPFACKTEEGLRRIEDGIKNYFTKLRDDLCRS